MINLPTTKPLEKKSLLLQVSHRFIPTIKSGYDTYFGLNGPANIFISLGYGISENFSVAFGHAKEKHEFELSLNWLFIEQNSFPVSMSLMAGGSLFTEPTPCEQVWRSENMKFNLQAIFSRQFSDRVSLLLVPTFVTNTNVLDSAEKNSIAVGTGGRFMVINDLSLIGEWVPVLAGYKAQFNSCGLGIEYKIGGHVFQIFVTNATGLTTDRYIPGGDLNISRNDYRLGFNIFRTF